MPIADAERAANRRDALAIYAAALQELHGRRLARAAAEALPRGRRCHLIAVGKAAHAMADGIGDVVDVERRVVVGTEDAGHPLPDDRSLAAGQRLLAHAAAATDLLVVTISGGASALAVAPAFGLGLDDKIAATRAIAAAGVPIEGLNCVRKHLSALKGGRLACATRAEIYAILLSDVIGDDPATIGSGPVSADATTFADALCAVHGVVLPSSVRAVLEAGARGELPETPKPGDSRLAHVRAILCAGPADLVRVAAETAERLGRPVDTMSGLRGSVDAVAAELVRRSRAGRAFVGGGEPTIVLPSRPGRGGRAQHVALTVAHELRGSAVVLAVGSDGIDGPTADAGGLVDATTPARARHAGVDPRAALARFDSGTALAAAGDLVVTGPTGTNLCDLYVVLP